MNTIDTLRATYLAAFTVLVERYPRQEQNRSSHEEWSSNAKLGILNRRIRTKGGHTDIPTGAVVLYLEDELEREVGSDWVAVWFPRADGTPTRTLVDADAVLELCGTCGGTGRVRHVNGLVAMGCPSC